MNLGFRSQEVRIHGIVLRRLELKDVGFRA